MSNDPISTNLNFERISIQVGWTEEEKQARRRQAGNKQLQLKQLVFLTAIASEGLRRSLNSSVQLG